MPSPCVSKCHIDTVWNLCVSCGRTLWEIEDWVGRTEEEQLDTMSVAEKRLTYYNQNCKRHVDFDITALEEGNEKA